VKVQQRVQVTVVEVDQARKRIALTMRKGSTSPARQGAAPAAANAKPQPSRYGTTPAATPRPAAAVPTDGWFSAALKNAQKKGGA